MVDGAVATIPLGFLRIQTPKTLWKPYEYRVSDRVRPPAESG